MLLLEAGKFVSKTSVLFVCLGNICRSPLGQGIFEYKVKERGLADKFIIDSCGTGSWHVGNPPHVGSIEIANKNNICIVNQRARDLDISDFEKFHWILAMDKSNLRDIKSMAPSVTSSRIHLLREFDPFIGDLDVPDPYYTGGFEGVFEIVERSCEVLIEEILGK